MSRMGEWFMEWREDDDLNMMLYELHHQEELERQEQEAQARLYPVVITPRAFIHEPHSSSPNQVHCVSGVPGVQQTISAEPSRTNNLCRRFPSVR
jgi:hypothetical protein